MHKFLAGLKTAIRWHIAYFLDRFPDVCWADAAAWAQFPENHDFAEVFKLRHTAGRCEADGDVPYCGKCAVLAERRGLVAEIRDWYFGLALKFKSWHLGLKWSILWRIAETWDRDTAG